MAASERLTGAPSRDSPLVCSYAQLDVCVNGSRPHLQIVDHDLAKIVVQSDRVVHYDHRASGTEIMAEPMHDRAAVSRVEVGEDAFRQKEGR